jgi:hypothetical protein
LTREKRGFRSGEFVMAAEVDWASVAALCKKQLKYNHNDSRLSSFDLSEFFLGLCWKERITLQHPE